MTEQKQFAKTLDEHGILQQECAELIKLQFGSFRVALTKPKPTKWMITANLFYKLGMDKQNALNSEVMTESK